MTDLARRRPPVYPNTGELSQREHILGLARHAQWEPRSLGCCNANTEY